MFGAQDGWGLDEHTEWGGLHLGRGEEVKYQYWLCSKCGKTWTNRVGAENWDFACMCDSGGEDWVRFTDRYLYIWDEVKR